MNRYLSRPLLAAALVVAATGIISIPASATVSDTKVACVNGQNAGYSNGGGGSTYWGWCHPTSGQYVRFKVEIGCQAGGGGTTDWASGSGDGTVFTEGETCWFGGVITSFAITNG